MGVGARTAARGRPAMPSKALVHVLACRVPVIMVPEAYTTIACPGCGQRTQQGNPDMGADVTLRDRVCGSGFTDGRLCRVQVAEHGDDVPQAVAYDRDVGGSTNIGMRGVCAICHIKDIIPGYPWVPYDQWLAAGGAQWYAGRYAGGGDGGDGGDGGGGDDDLDDADDADEDEMDVAD
jgi:hypothetical protein